MSKEHLEMYIADGGGLTTSIGTELKFEDTYISGMATYFSGYAEELQGGIDRYLQIMHDIRENAIIEGDTARALDTFIMYADKLKEVIRESGSNAKTLCENFVEIVDQKDDKFY